MGKGPRPLGSPRCRPCLGGRTGFDVLPIEIESLPLHLSVRIWHGQTLHKLLISGLSLALGGVAVRSPQRSRANVFSPL